MTEERTENEVRELVRDFFNGNAKPRELYNEFNLEECSICGNVDLKEDLMDTEEEVNGGVGYVCEDCYNDHIN